MLAPAPFAVITKSPPHRWPLLSLPLHPLLRASACMPFFTAAPCCLAPSGCSTICAGHSGLCEAPLSMCCPSPVQAARPGSASIDRFEAANKELQHVEREKVGRGRAGGGWRAASAALAGRKCTRLPFNSRPAVAEPGPFAATPR